MMFAACAMGCAQMTSIQPAAAIRPQPPKPAASSEIERAGQPLPRLGTPRIVISKSERRLELYDGDHLVKTYKISLGFAPEGDKLRQGDGKTPEGEYLVVVKNDKSRYYLSLGLNYPSVKDAEQGLANRLITRAQYDAIARSIKERKLPPQNTRLGGEIYIHGGGSASDWTLGCVALDDPDIRELFEVVSIGTVVVIEP
jgi:murein L,D-transpeptidase YafK